MTTKRTKWIDGTNIAVHVQDTNGFIYYTVGRLDGTWKVGGHRADVIKEIEQSMLDSEITFDEFSEIYGVLVGWRF